MPETKPQADWNPHPDRGRKLQYDGSWNGLPLSVTLVKGQSPDHFYISIESPFFNVKRELVGKDVLAEVDKVYQFLKYDPAPAGPLESATG